MTTEQRAAQIAQMTNEQCQTELDELLTIAQRGIGNTDAEFEAWVAMLEARIAETS